VRLEHRSPPGRDEDLVRDDRALAAYGDRPPGPVVIGPLDLHARAQLDPVSLQRRDE